MQSQQSFTSGLCIAPEHRVNVGNSKLAFQLDDLDSHNEKQKQHYVPYLVLDSNLNKIARDLADNLLIEDRIPPVYQSDTMFNIFYNNVDFNRQSQNVINDFYRENKYYNWTNPDLVINKSFRKVQQN
ncbi:hypothetical protein I4U23_017187 [Adineta vaga]|nr:hypothetical protein I4U23_017187 [Adineta vaga]